MRGGIGDRPTGLNDGARCRAGRLQAALPHNVENGFPAGDKIIGDNAPVASPPYSLRTHHRAPPLASLIEKMLEARVKLR